MEWTADVAVGDWLRERIDDPWRATMHDVVPRGFEAYARVFHPTTCSRPVDRPWPPFPADRHRREWEAFAAAQPEIETRRARWTDVAKAFGTTLHPLAQWNALVRSGHVDPGAVAPAVSADGWDFDAPVAGDLDTDVLAAVVGTLATGDVPSPGYAAVWSGWGGLIGFTGTAPSSTTVGVTEPGDTEQRLLRDTLARSVTDPFNRPYATQTWHPGILPDEVSRGTMLELPEREHVLFRGDLRLFADPEWPRRVPWKDPGLEEGGFERIAPSPSILWPTDRSWVVVTDVDWDSTIVGGDSDAIALLCTRPDVEALVLPAGSSLQWDADEVNR
jgi:hypothetical protein